MKKRCAIFTLVHNEKHFLPLWVFYYSSLFGMENLYILDHESTDGSTNNLKCNVKIIRHNTLHDDDWMIEVLKEEQKRLLEEYDYVVCADADEFIIPDPDKYRNLSHYVDYMKENSIDAICCFGHEVIHKRHEEPPLDWSKPILVDQRRYWIDIEAYDKPIIASKPLNWSLGRHIDLSKKIERDEDLILVHLHRVDFEMCRCMALYKNRSGRCSIKYSPYVQYTDDEFEKYFDLPYHYRNYIKDPNSQLGTVSEIPDRYRGTL